MAKLKIYTDENVDVRVVDGLKRRGIKAFTAADQGMAGAPDTEHFKYTRLLQAVLFTHDHHFLEMAKAFGAEGKEHYGVIFVEMNKYSAGECIKRLTLYAEILSTEEMKNAIEFL